VRDFNPAIGSGPANCCLRALPQRLTTPIRHLAHAQGDVALFRELAGVAQYIQQNLLEPHGVRGERANVLVAFRRSAAGVRRII
jgi:hypothetical protein